jgi:hypothetical protein
MWRIGTVATYQDARRLGIYFQSYGKGTRLEEQPDGWAIWVCDDAPWARKELEAFKRNPDDPRFPPPLSSPESLLDGMRPANRQIVEMHLHGYTIDQIATWLNVSPYKVRRVLHWFEARFEQQQRLPWLNEPGSD